MSTPTLQLEAPGLRIDDLCRRTRAYLTPEQIRQIGVDAVPIVALLAVTIGLSLAINGIAQLERPKIAKP